ncbi:MAG: hypothetical protein JWM21_114 [Acidobacteria bacterium]|nr:hypothetical protein [Acidobacteriota bacterium]
MSARVVGRGFSFSPGFNRVVIKLFLAANRFNGFSSLRSKRETVKTVLATNSAAITRLKPGENEMSFC